MAWVWYDITDYYVSVGGEGYYYGGVQISGEGFVANLRFYKEGPLPNSTAQIVSGQQRFLGHMYFEQIAVVIDLLRNEKPVRFGWSDANPNQFHLMTGKEPVGEGDGFITE